MRRHVILIFMACLFVTTLLCATSRAALTVAPKKELKEIAADAGKIGPLVVKKKISDATAALDKVKDRLSTFISKHGLKENDPGLKFVHSQIEKAEANLARATEKAGA